MKTEPDKQIDKIPTVSSIFFKATLLSLAFATIMLLITALGVGIWGFSKLHNFTKLADTSISELKTTFTTGWNTPVTHSNYKKNILLLGIDSLKTRPGSPALTDTIMILSLDLKSGKISTISLPRDLWNNDYITRINALYFYGQEKYPTKPERFTKEIIEDMTGLEIHHTIVISIDSVAEIIDILGGINVDVKQGFTDAEFPRPNVDVTKVTDPKKLYQTIVFEKGQQHMDGERALQFIRSRKSEDDQGDDLARSERQQIIINSLIQKIKNLNPVKNEETWAQLYKYYQKTFSQQLPMEEVIATAKTIFPIRNNISLSNNAISIYPDDKLGVITNPPKYKYNGEWVYEILDKQAFKNEILTKLEN